MLSIKSKARKRLRFTSIFKTTTLSAFCFIGTVSLSGCTSLFYHPTDLMYVSTPSKLENLRQEVEFRSSDGVKLAGWFFPARKEGHRGALIQFHGNAQNITSHFAILYWVIDHGYDFFTFDYRGYGISEGKPSEEGLNRDALAAIDYIMHREPARKKEGKQIQDIVLYGQSLGGAVLLRAYQDVPEAERARVRAVIAESTFYSYHAIARDVLSRFWITYLFQPLADVLISNAYSPKDSIPLVSPTPLLVIHGDADPVIPISFGEKIYSLARPPKTFWKIPGGGHINSMTAFGDLYRSQLLNYLSLKNY